MGHLSSARFETNYHQAQTVVLKAQKLSSFQGCTSLHGQEWDYPAVAIENAKRRYERHVLSVGKARKAGIKVAAGTDVIDNDTVAMECARLVDAGFTPMEAIVAATGAGAEILKKESEIGTIEVGKKADLVILGGNPLEDIKCLELVETVVKDGKIIDRSSKSREEVLRELRGVV